MSEESSPYFDKKIIEQIEKQIEYLEEQDNHFHSKWLIEMMGDIENC